MKISKLYIGLLALGIGFFSSCTKYDNPAPFFEEYDQEVERTIKNKVLVINIDGLVGSQLKTYMPANMTKMLTNAKYSYKAQSDKNTSDPASLVSLVTGVPSSIHHVETDTYLPESTGKDEHGHGTSTFFPSFLYRLEERDKAKNTSVFMRNNAFTGAYLTSVDQFVVENSDAQIKSRAVDYITKNHPDFIMVQLSDLQEAGKSGGFVTSNAKYKSALDAIDGHVGDLLKAIEAREGAEFENWLVVLCSAHGGTSTGSYGNSSVDEMSTFSMYYNKKFKGIELNGDELNSFYANGYFAGAYNYYDATGKTRDFAVDGARAMSPSGASSNLLNASATNEITYEFKIKLRPDTYWAGTTFSGGYRNYYNFIMGKDDNDNTSAGWHIYGQDMSFSLRVQDGSKTESFSFGRGNDGSWNHYAITFKRETNVTTKAVMYVNGEQAGSQVFKMAISAFSNTHPLTFGFAKQGYQNLSFLQADFADVRVWNKELTKEQVAQITCLKWIPDNFPLKDNLIAYYTQFDGLTWKNSITDKGVPDMTISRNTEFLSGSNVRLGCGVIPEYVYLQNIDLARQTFYWLGVDINPEWGIQGNLFLKNFENEFNQ